jgi:hypothetical protein
VWQILLSKILLLLNLVKHVSKFFLNSKDSKSARIFSLAFVFSNFVIFHSIKVAKTTVIPGVRNLQLIFLHFVLH